MGTTGKICGGDSHAGLTRMQQRGGANSEEAQGMVLREVIFKTKQEG